MITTIAISRYHYIMQAKTHMRENHKLNDDKQSNSFFIIKIKVLSKFLT